MYIGINGIKFKRETSCRFLGVILHQKLSWIEHMDHVKSQVAKAVGTLYTISSCLPLKILKTLYSTLVQPFFVYCMPIWGNNLDSSKFKDLFILQKKAIRIVTRNTKKIDNRFAHTKPSFNNLKLLTIHNLYYYLTACEARKIIINKSPPLLYEMFFMSLRPTSSTLILPKFRKSGTAKNSFVFNSSKILNTLLQSNIQYNSKLTQDTFKKKLKLHFLYKQTLTTQNIKTLNESDDWLPININLYSDCQV